MACEDNETLRTNHLEVPMYEHVVMWWTMFTDRLRKESDGMATAELLGNAALGVAALVAIWLLLKALGVDIVEWIRGQLMTG